MKWMKIHNSPSMAGKRKDLRIKETPEEKILWGYLRNQGLKNCKFRRQHSVGGYILDFYCPSRRLAIEVDGMHHLNPEKARYDIARTEFLQTLNIQVLRFMNKEINTNIDSVLDKISTFL
jgi:very-short-patch-repair endonuclease